VSVEAPSDAVLDAADSDSVVGEPLPEVVPLALVNSPVYAEARTLVPFLHGGGVPEMLPLVKVMSAHCIHVSGRGVARLELEECIWAGFGSVICSCRGAGGTWADNRERFRTGDQHVRYTARCCHDRP
jgi:hypothetical protein